MELEHAAVPNSIVIFDKGRFSAALIAGKVRVTRARPYRPTRCCIASG